LLSIAPFVDEAEAWAIADHTRYGLRTYLHTKEPDRPYAFAKRLQVGYIMNNVFASMAPFGGYKHSGFGSTGRSPGMEEYPQVKNIFVVRCERQL
jgi:acyl-CoA reductase-like NAD-dependent aldehyde dehydrogenase